MRKTGALVTTLMAMCLAGSAWAIPTATNITGHLSKAENTCVSPIEFFQFTYFQLCSYSGGVDIQSVVTSAPSLDFHNWMGPQDSGGFYAKGFLPSPREVNGFTGSTPGDGKIELEFTGTITIEDSQTPGVDDDKISGTLIFGPGERAASSSNGNAVEQFDGITHTIPATTVSSATVNAMGGFDYVIGSQGYPFLISSAAGDYPSEEASIANDDTVPPNFNAWADFNGGNITNATLPPYTAPPTVPGLIPHSVEIVSYAPGAANNSNVEPNVGLKTTAVVANLVCESGDGDDTPDMTQPDPPDVPELIDDCNPDPAIGAGSTWVVSGAEFDNLILKVSTDANFKVISAEAFYTLEYKIESLNLNGGNPGSFVGGRLNLTALAEAVNDAASTTDGVPIDIDILANDIGFSDDVTITLGAMPSGAAATINGANPGPQAGIDVTYTPGATGEEFFDYTISDGLKVDTATVTVTVFGSGGGSSFPIAPTVGLNTGEGEVLDFDVALLPGVSLGVTPVVVTVVAQPSSGTTTVAGQRIAYTPRGFPTSDEFDYTITSADGKTSTGTIFVNISPQLTPTAIADSAETIQDIPVNIDVKLNDLPGSGDIADHTIRILKVFVIDLDDPEDPNDGRAAVNGDAVVEADGTVTFTPDPGVAGVHTFRYTLTDVGGTQGPDESEPVTVTVTVEKGELTISLPDDSSSAIGPWSLGLLVIVGWLRRRRK